MSELNLKSPAGVFMRSARFCLTVLMMSIVMFPALAWSQQRAAGRLRLSGAPNVPFQPPPVASGCPDAAASNPSRAPAQPTDFVELQRTPCYGSCPVYTVQIRGDGQVNWRQPSLGPAGAAT